MAPDRHNRFGDAAATRGHFISTYAWLCAYQVVGFLVSGLGDRAAGGRVEGLPRVEVVIVRSPSSGLVGPGAVLIEHRSTSGRDDVIARPSEEAVPLFWRFMIEKFGVAPTR
ncbi:hypothetical protein [Micromonospora sp. DT63]|uniref:hypothetical protein n=1 Tax=Micromonospora sp. DT63 TaxID=3393441 RepID=UPI003CE79058